MIMPLVDIDPKDKAMIDALLESRERERSRRAWSFWLCVGAASFAALWCVRYEFIPFALRVALVAAGGLGMLLFLAFLSTKPFGRGYYSGPAWWWVP